MTLFKPVQFHFFFQITIHNFKAISARDRKFSYAQLSVRPTQKYKK